MQAKPTTAHVVLEEGDEHLEKEIASGETALATLKTELGLAADAVVYLRHGDRRTLLSDQERVDVSSGLHFVAVNGGGVS